MELDVDPFSLELATPLRTAAGAIEEREGFLVRVDADGARGLGEATPLPGWTESLPACRAALAEAGEVLRASGPDAALAAADGTPAARHGLALALADLRARQLDVPLWRELGRGAPPPTVPVNATVGDGPVEETVATARTAVDAGFDCVKCKVGARDLGVDRERLAAVREAVGPAVALRADANGAWDLETARSASGWLGDLDVEYVEQPLPADDLAGHAALRDGPVDVALDESLASNPVERVLDRDAADAVVLKPMVLGGPERTARVARRARAAGVVPVLSTTVDAVVARVGAVHVACALAPIGHCGLATATHLAEDLAPDPSPVDAGEIAAPAGPGLGVDVESA